MSQVWKYIIASAFKFKLRRQPAQPIMVEARASWVETSGTCRIFSASVIASASPAHNGGSSSQLGGN